MPAVLNAELTKSLISFQKQDTNLREKMLGRMGTKPADWVFRCSRAPAERTTTQRGPRPSLSLLRVSVVPPEVGEEIFADRVPDSLSTISGPIGALAKGPQT